MTELVVYRGIQGLGAGGLMVLAQTTIADLVAPRERGRYQGLFGAVFAFSSVAGPLLGGFITSALSWRWIFYVNVPVGILALAMIVFGFHRPHHKVPHHIDYAAVVLLTSATVALLLVLSWGGVQYAWSSPLIIGLAMASVCSALSSARAELRWCALPHLPQQDRGDRYAVMGLAIGIFSAFVFLPRFFSSS
jgi:MFS family permease